MRLAALACFALLTAFADVPPGEEPVAPYTQSDANAGTTPIKGDAVFKAFHGREGVQRVADELVRLNTTDPRIKDIFAASDLVRLRRTLGEQFCYVLGGGCKYTGMDMKSSHKDQGVQATDFGALVENLQLAMNKEKVPFWAQNRLLAKLAPMKRDVVVR